MTMESFKKETMEASQQYWCTYYHGFFWFFLSDYGEELRVMIMKPGMVWHKDQITFKIEYNVN